MNGETSIWRVALGLVMTAIIVGGVYLLSMAIELFGEEREPGVIRGPRCQAFSCKHAKPNNKLSRGA